MIDDLKRGILFERLSEKQLQRIAQRAHRIHLQAGQSLFEQGDPADRFYLVLKGQIKLYRLSPAGDEKVIEVVKPGSTFAEALMFFDHPHYPVGAESLRESEVISIDARDFASMLRESVETCFLMMGDMSQRLRGLIREIDDISLHSATCRVAGYLLTHSPENGEPFKLEIPKQILASRLSVKAETFSRIIKQLNEQNILEVSGSTVHIRNRDALETLADTCAYTKDSLESTFRHPCPPPAGKA